MASRWKVNLNGWEFGFLVTCVVIAMFSAYFFGYRSGHAIGYDDAQRAALEKTARYAVFDDAPKDLDDESLDQIYASLNSAAIIEEQEEELDETDLAAIETISVKEGNDDQEMLPEEVKPEIPEAKKVIEEEKIEVVEEVKEEVVQPEKEAELVKEPVQEEVKEAIVEEKKVKPAMEHDFSKPPAGWYVQVATTKSPEAVYKLSKDLKSTGFPVEVEKITLGQKDFYRVLVGPESKKDYANRLVDQLGRERYLSGKPFVRNLK